MTTELTLSHGSHDTPEDGLCLMEAVAFLAGEAHSDHPECACPVLASYARTLNDRMGAGEEGDALRAEHLLPLAQKLVGTRSTPEVERRRAYFLADRAVRLFAPLALEAAGFTERADALRALPEIVDEQTAEAAKPTREAVAWVAWVADAADASAAAAAYAAESAYAARAARAAEAAAWEQAAKVLAEACEITE